MAGAMWRLGTLSFTQSVNMLGFGTVDYATSQAGKDAVLTRLQYNLDIERRPVKQRLNLRHLHLPMLEASA